MNTQFRLLPKPLCAIAQAPRWFWSHHVLPHVSWTPGSNVASPLHVSQQTGLSCSSFSAFFHQSLSVRVFTLFCPSSFVTWAMVPVSQPGPPKPRLARPPCLNQRKLKHRAEHISLLPMKLQSLSQATESFQSLSLVVKVSRISS